MKCGKCGAELNDNMRFCVECGTPVRRQSLESEWVLIESWIGFDLGEHEIRVSRHSGKTEAIEKLVSAINESGLEDVDSGEDSIAAALGNGYQCNDVESSFVWRLVEV